MQTLVITATEHNTARELVDDEHLSVLDDVVDVALHNAARLDGLIDVVQQRHVVGIHQVLDFEERLRLTHARLGEGGGTRLLVDDIIARDGVLIFFGVGLFDAKRRQGLGELVGDVV